SSVSPLVVVTPGGASRHREDSPGVLARFISHVIRIGNRRSVINPGGDAHSREWVMPSPLFFSNKGVIAMKNGRSLISLATELERQLHSKKDLIVPSALVRHVTDDLGDTRLIIEEGGSPVRYGVTPLARRQLADKLKIPYAYFERMREDQPALLDRNVNIWLQSEEEQRMLRTLDGQVRAVLSDRYRRLDNFDLAESVLPILQQLPEVRFESVELTETKMYLKCITPRLSYEMAPGDVVQAGVMISNSEVGQGTLSVQPLLFRLVCSNGLIAADRSLRKTHVGRALGTEDERIQVYQDDTLRADDKAFFLKVRDVVQAAVSEATFRQTAQKLQKTLNIPLVGDPVKTIEVLAQRYTLNDTERAGVLRHLIAEGQLSGYGLVNAVTHYSQEVEDYDRATEFEALGGRLIDLPAHEWKGLAEAA
ncbi:MAG: DUF932 domain-containing protein, partial [Georgfuchsia sp.]